MNVGETIRARRQALGITQADMAARLGVAPSMVCQIERGSKAPSLPLAAEIARLLGCSIDALCGAGKEVTS